MTLSLSRRSAIAAAAVTTAGWLASRSSNFCEAAQPSAADDSEGRFPICVFTKPFNSLSYEEMAERLATMGFDGLEATVRRGGNVEPAAVKEQLPKLVEALTKRGMSLTIMTTDVNDVDDPTSRQVLQTAAELGVDKFRMRYVKYDAKSSVTQQLDGWKRQFGKLAALCGQLGINGLYQNHAGANYMGAPLWDLDRVLSDIDPQQIGVAYDIRHATVEGGTSWPITWRMILPRVRTVYVKDFNRSGDRVTNVPLGEGLVQASFFKQLLESDYTGPISLHEEYLDHKDPALVPQHFDAIQADLKTLRGLLDEDGA